MNDLGLDREAAAMLMIESDMPGAAAVDELERAEAACRAAGATNMVARRRRDQEADWLRQARRAAHYALERMGDVRMEDVGVPALARARTCSARSRRSRRKHGVRIGTFGHAGDGNLHPDLVFERGDPNAEAKSRSASRRTSTRPPSTSAARSPASTASGPPGATGSRSRRARTRSA